MNLEDKERKGEKYFQTSSKPEIGLEYQGL